MIWGQILIFIPIILIQYTLVLISIHLLKPFCVERALTDDLPFINFTRKIFNKRYRTTVPSRPLPHHITRSRLSFIKINHMHLLLSKEVYYLVNNYKCVKSNCAEISFKMRYW